MALNLGIGANHPPLSRARVGLAIELAGQLAAL
jgi:hypothetical protein